MFTLTTPRAILLGFLAVALAVGSIPFGMKLMDVNAMGAKNDPNFIQRVQICGTWGVTDATVKWHCAAVSPFGLDVKN
jgi:hypothetical protein